jgi:hypothetical protein
VNRSPNELLCGTYCFIYFILFYFIFYLFWIGNDWSVPVVTSSLVWREHSTTNGHSCKMGNCFVRNEIVTFDTVPSVSLLGLVVAFHALSFSWQCLALFKNPVQDY